MLIDLTVETSLGEGEGLAGRGAPFGHRGTHFDVMDRRFPLAYAILPGLALDLRRIGDRDLGIDDLDLGLVEGASFLGLCTGFGAAHPYGRPGAPPHPQVAPDLLEALLDRRVAVIGIDAPGLRRGREHTPADQRCADAGCFVVENLVNLEEILRDRPWARFKAYTFPVSFAGMTGLPCRVVGEVDDPQTASPV